jgi:hypothetical protein
VRRDTTVSVGGAVYEVPLGYLAGQLVTIATSLFDGKEPVIELDNKRIPLSVVDPVSNSTRRRPPRRDAPARPEHAVDFDPAKTLTSQNEEGSDDELF